jgi:hypothetical protein
MSNRICPGEEVLSAYLGDCLSPEEKTSVERHLAGCSRCRELMIDTLNVMKSEKLYDLWRNVFRSIKKNLWLIGALSAFSLSFIFPGYFMQFLAVSLVMGMKWLLEARSMKTILMVYEAWKVSRKSDDKETFFHERSRK